MTAPRPATSRPNEPDDARTAAESCECPTDTHPRWHEFNADCNEPIEPCQCRTLAAVTDEREELLRGAAIASQVAHEARQEAEDARAERDALARQVQAVEAAVESVYADHEAALDPDTPTAGQGVLRALREVRRRAALASSTPPATEPTDELPCTVRRCDDCTDPKCGPTP